MPTSRGQDSAGWQEPTSQRPQSQHAFRAGCLARRPGLAQRWLLETPPKFPGHLGAGIHQEQIFRDEATAAVLSSAD